MSAILEVCNLHVHFSGARTRRRHGDSSVVHAVDGLSLFVEAGSAVGIVGESGCGKSTLARAIVGLVAPTSGTVRFAGMELPAHRDVESRRRIQMVFQDPGSSLNPRMTVGQVLKELLRVHDIVPRDRIDQRCAELMELVGLSPSLLDVRPRRLSGGQRQRVGIARALAVEPEILIADEAVAALDVSVQAAIVNLLVDLQRRLGLTLLFIAHDLAVVRNLSDRVAVMYLGRVVETGPTEVIFRHPRHPYTRALLDAVPRLEHRRQAGHALLPGEPPSPLRVPTGCRFHPRCPRAEERCRTDDPALHGPPEHLVACHFAWTDPMGPSAAHAPATRVAADNGSRANGAAARRS